MKSILVDALRQANEDEPQRELSDSGRFDTIREDFSATANQEMIDATFGDGDEELELMSTTRGLTANDGEAAPGEAIPAQLGETLAGATVLLTGSDCVVPDSDSLPPMPRLARHVPILCVAIALFAAAAWQGYQRLELRQYNSALGAIAMQTQAAAGQDELASDEPPAQRFRYLRSALPIDADEGEK